MELSILEFHDTARFDRNWTPAVQVALAKLKGGTNTVLRFPKGEYHFWPEGAESRDCYIHANGHDVRWIVFPLTGCRDLTLDGEGSSFIFHGRVSPFILEDCTNVTLRNFSLDTARPFFTQGDILSATAEYVDVRIDPVAFPYRVENGLLTVVADVWETTIDKTPMTLSFNPASGGPAHNMPYYFPTLRAEERAEGVVRVYARFTTPFRVGDVLVIEHGGRQNGGIIISGSRNVRVENLDIFQIGGMGVVGQLSEDISLYRVRVMPTPGSGRLVSTGADATHWVHCTGRITMEDCVFESMLDDGCNVRGIYTRIRNVERPSVLEVELMRGDQSGHNLYRPGDRVALVEVESLGTVATAVVKSARLLSPTRIRLEVVDPLPEELGCDAVVENPMRMPELVIRNCRTGKNRGRGLLLATPGRTVVEGCTFYNSDYGIFVHGDLKNWHESGPVTDLTIRSNTFQDCAYAVANSPICIFPNIPTPVAPAAPYYHRNIRIEDNIFEHFEEHLLTAISVDGLRFTGNRFRRTTTYPPRNTAPVVGMDHVSNKVIEELSE